MQSKALKADQHKYTDAQAYAVVVLDRKEIITACNSTTEYLFDYPAGSIVGKHYSWLFTDEDIAEGKPQWELKQALSSGYYEERSSRKRSDGSVFEVITIITPLHSELNHPMGFSVRMRDISNTKQTEPTLPDNAAALRSLIDTAAEAIVTIDESARILVFNQAAEKLLRYAAVDVIGQDINIFLHSIYPENDKFNVSQYMQTSIKEVIGIPQRVVIQQKNGGILPVELLVSETQCDQGKLYTTIIRDLTNDSHLKETDFQLTSQLSDSDMEFQEKINLLESIIENVPSMIFMKDAKELRLRLVNKVAEEVMGYSREELLSNPDEVLFPKEHVEVYHLHDREALETKKLVDITEEPLITKAGTRILHTKKVPILDDQGEAVYVLGISEDITQAKEDQKKIKCLNKQLEEQVLTLNSLNKELEAFSYSVSHDLMAPLRTIDGFSHALLEIYKDKLDDRGKNYLNRVRLGSQQMGQLINDMLKLSRLTRDELSLENQVNLTQIAQEISATLKSQEPERNVDFDIESGIVVHGDRRLLQSVLENLLGNAWKYTAKHPTAHIEFGKIHALGVPVYYVKDNGAGFDMRYADKLFLAFQRLHSKTEFPGTGIGLASVARVIHRHGGEVWAESEMEKGSTFFFTLQPVSEEVKQYARSQQSYSIGRR